MYRVIIADDESAVRERLLSLVNKLNKDFEVVGSFENGYDTLEALETLQPDLLITDIKMPYIDGIELIKQAKLELPLLQTIIISGYDSFDYAKQAIDLKVVGYISKPISFDELKEAMYKAKNEIDKELSIDKNIIDLQEQAKTNLSFIQEDDLCKLLSQKELTQNFKDKLKADQIDITLKYCILGVFDFDEDLDKIGYEKSEIVGAYLHKYIPDELKQYKCYVFNRSNQTLFLALNEKQFVKDEIEEKLASIISKIYKTCGVSLSVALSEPIDDTNRSYRRMFRHATRTLTYRTVVGNNNVLFFSDIQKEEVSIGKIDDNEYKAIAYDLSYGNIDDCKNKVSSILNRIKNPEYADSYFYINSNITNFLLKSCTNFKELYKTYMDNNQIFQEIYNSKNIDSLEDLYYSLIDAIAKVNETTRAGGVETCLKQILLYIETNYTDPDLSLETLSGSLNYSVSYISLLLKRDDKTFTKYLMSVRMEHAKELLIDPNNKIVNISEMVGYRDPYYFSHCFKKYFGVSPLEYRKK
ncbi:MAG: response regulator [Bacilli bacterium]